MIHEGVRKLKLEKYPSILLQGKAADIEALAPWAKPKAEKPYDAVIEVVLDLEQMRQALRKTFEQGLLQEKGLLFMLYPKKGNKQYDTYIHRDSIFDVIRIDDDGYFEDTTLKFNSMTAFDEVFTALGIKNEPIKAKKNTAPSQCVDDYKGRLDELRALLDETTLASFNELTPGYQGGWARHVFSTKSEQTRQKRLGEMKALLTEGFKSIDLWRKAKK